MELQHFSHEHPLILTKYQNFRDDDGIVYCCDGCLDPILSSPSYSCNQCKYILHKSCADLPREVVKHPLHPKHPLTLLAEPHYSNCSCDICESDWENFTYHCPLCRFDLDIKCASLTDRKIEHPSHNHLLTLSERPVLSLCDACGTKHEGFFYLCTTCNKFWIHRDCALLPTTIKRIDHHDHPLTLAYSIPSPYSTFVNYCDICTKEINEYYGAYYCGECRFFAHITCATSRDEAFMSIILPWSKAEIATKVEDPRPDAVELPVLDETVTLINHFRGDTIMEKNEKTNQLNHFGHDHPLICIDGQGNDQDLHCEGKRRLLNNARKCETLCNACLKPILTSPFYKCVNRCNYFLHKCCTELPVEVQHPCHPQHPLVLIPKRGNPFGLFYCNGCNSLCNGFAYTCVECEYYLDLKCAFLPRTIRHEAHKDHFLTLREKVSNRCRASYHWDNSGFAFRCETCNFELDTRCALLSRTIRHRYDELHPFTLTCFPVKSHSDEYICDICEQELNPKWWFYHCVECDHSMHTTCAPQFDKWSSIKFGSTLNIESHQHPLTLVPVTKENTWCDNFGRVITNKNICSCCDKSFHIFEYPYPFGAKCLECNIMLHYGCISKHGKEESS